MVRSYCSFVCNDWGTLPCLELILVHMRLLHTGCDVRGFRFKLGTLDLHCAATFVLACMTLRFCQVTPQWPVLIWVHLNVHFCNLVRCPDSFALCSSFGVCSSPPFPFCRCLPTFPLCALCIWMVLSDSCVLHVIF